MPNFLYTALDAKGEQINGVVPAATEADAIQQLRSQGLYPTQIQEEGKGARPRPALRRRVKPLPKASRRKASSAAA